MFLTFCRIKIFLFFLLNAFRRSFCEGNERCSIHRSSQNVVQKKILHNDNFLFFAIYYFLPNQEYNRFVGRAQQNHSLFRRFAYFKCTILYISLRDLTIQ